MNTAKNVRKLKTSIIKFELNYVTDCCDTSTLEFRIIRMRRKKFRISFEFLAVWGIIKIKYKVCFFNTGTWWHLSKFHNLLDQHNVCNCRQTSNVHAACLKTDFKAVFSWSQEIYDLAFFSCWNPGVVCEVLLEKYPDQLFSWEKEIWIILNKKFF